MSLNPYYQSAFFSYPVIISLWIILIIVSLWVSASPQRITASIQNNYHSSYFHWGGLPDPFIRPNPAQAIQFPQNNNLLEFPVTFDDQVPLTILFQCSGDCPLIKLADNVKTDLATTSAFLYHPTLNQLQWQRHTDKSGINFYQRLPLHQSLASLLKDPNQKVAVEDKYLTYFTSQYPQANLVSLQNSDEFDSITSIITSYSHPQKIHDWYRFQAIFPTTHSSTTLPLYLTIDAPEKVAKNIKFIFPQFQMQSN